MKKSTAVLSPPVLPSVAVAPVVPVSVLAAPQPDLSGYWGHYRGAVDKALAALTVTSACGDPIDSELAFEMLVVWSRELRKKGGTQYFVGNGASSAMAGHMALDWSKNGGVRSMSFNDPAVLTAIGNDLGFDQVFAEPLRRFGRLGDLLISISSSGNSPNVVHALKVARAQGLLIATFSGMKPDNASRSAGDLNFYIPASTYGVVECTHQVLLHAWLDRHLALCEWAPSA